MPATTSKKGKRRPAKKGGAAQQFLSVIKFEDLMIHKDTKRALKEAFNYEYLSQPQAEYLPVALSGKNIFVKAKTGSGKTLGFLIPVLERISRASRVTATRTSNATSTSTTAMKPVRALVISPSRELAVQTSNEASKLAKFHTTIDVQMVIGGTDPGAERRRLQSQNADILVATPGRLLDHIENLSGFADNMRKNVRCVVIDEADRLLDMGFLPALKRIFAVLPSPAKRQALLFTATVPAGVTEIAQQLSPDFEYVDTAKGDDGEEARASHENIDQGVAVLPIQQIFRALHRVLLAKREAKKDHRIIVFFTTARMAQFAAALFRKCPAFADTLELHSRLSQGQRNKNTATFGNKSGCVLFASDVIARGIDFPDVTFVAQVGLTDPQQYEHRVGRTGRAGKSGEALMLLGEDEARLMQKLREANLPVKDAAQQVSREHRAGVDAMFDDVLSQVSRSSDLKKQAAQAYAATLGFYASNMKRLGWTPAQVVSSVNDRFLALGLPETPAIQAKTAAKMHLKGAPGLRMES